MQKFTQQLPKDDLKKFAKEVGKKLVASDFKNHRVEDPTKISEKQEKKVKKYVREYFEKAVEKKKAMDRRKKEKADAASSLGEKSKDASLNGNEEDKGVIVVNGFSAAEANSPEEVKVESDVEMSDDEDKDDPIPETPSFTESSDLKRKREEDEFGTPGDDADSSKRLKEEDDSTVDVSPPPPPPPPPADGMPDMSIEGAHDHDGHIHVVQVKEETEEEKELRKQEEDLMRENEEAMLMDMDGSLKAEEKLHNHNGVDELHSNGLPERKGVLSH